MCVCVRFLRAVTIPVVLSSFSNTVLQGNRVSLFHMVCFMNRNRLFISNNLREFATYLDLLIGLE